MNILLIGYGKMGKTIHKLAEKKGHQISSIIDIDNRAELQELSAKSDVAIEFTNPEAAYQNIHTSLQLGLPIVSGTTGWLRRYQDIRDLSQQAGVGFFYSSNYSIGVNIFFAINKKLAAMMSPYPDYHVRIDETHHIHKLDKPSGTAITAAEDILEVMKETEDWILDKDEVGKLSISSFREGEVCGKHTVHYNSPIDEIILTHNAHTRDGFAMGAIMAAEWIIDKKGPHNMNDLLGL